MATVGTGSFLMGLPMPSSDRLVVFRGGVFAALAVVMRLNDLEFRGARFVLKPDGGFRVVPPAVLSPADTAFLRLHRDEARRVLEYQADDAHLFTDRRLAQTPRLPGPRERTV
jgi:hypothetical protein